MRARPMIAATVTTGLLDAIRSAGADPEQFLRQVGLDNSVLLNTDGFLPCSAYARALEGAASLTSDSYFGLHFGERANPNYAHHALWVGTLHCLTGSLLVTFLKSVI